MQQRAYDCMTSYLRGMAPYLDDVLRRDTKWFQPRAGRGFLEVTQILWLRYLSIRSNASLRILAEDFGEDALRVQQEFRFLLYLCMHAWATCNHMDPKSFHIKETLTALELLRSV